MNGLWILGTEGTKLINREWIISELNRHRPLIGECLGSFASAFPIAFLESQFNLNNKYSIMYGLSGSNLSEHSLEGQDVMNKLSKNLPSLQETINEIGALCESGGRYEDAPHVIEILLPTICSYLNYWWNHGPSARQQATDILSKSLKLEKTKSTDTDKVNQSNKLTASKPNATTPLAALTYNEKVEGAPLTDVTSALMNQVLGYILKLVSNNIEEKEASWMNRIASKINFIILITKKIFNVIY